ncbi:MAG: nitroreductase family deazaflavin-dependent oxidoreductase [Actinomycetota bacterium]
MTTTTTTWPDANELPFAYLTTSGRRTGRDHTIEIWFAATATGVYLISGAGERADWVRNLHNAPIASVRIGDTTVAAQAQVPVPDGDERSAAVRMLHAKYADQVSSTVDAWHRDAYIVALYPHINPDTKQGENQ